MQITISDIIKQSKQPVIDSTIIVLVWIAACDDQISTSEIELISIFTGESSPEPYINKIRNIIDDSDPDEFGDAFGMLLALPQDRKKQFMLAAVQMAIADGRLSISENIILRLISDVLFRSGRILNELYYAITEDTLPPIADPSSVNWWEKNSSSKKNNSSNKNKYEDKRNFKGDHDQKKSDNRNSDEKITHSEAYKILGLEQGASSDDIKFAYKRLAKLHHPDKFHSHGVESVEAANLIFRRIKQAYEVLKA